MILKLDLENFFDHIMFYMVYQQAFPASYFPAPVRTLLAHLCCCREMLPQGAPTSAYISNLVLKSFDDYMGIWCQERNITYTRYSDDITCSGSFNPHAVIRKISSYLQSMGFYLNEQKIHIISRSQNQLITGITANQKLQAPREYRKNLRQEFYYCKKYGIVSHLQVVNTAQHVPDSGDIQRYLRTLLGKINHILYINPEDIYFREAAATVKQWLKTADKAEAGNGK